jgi:hypothetical protein
MHEVRALLRRDVVCGRGTGEHGRGSGAGSDGVGRGGCGRRGGCAVIATLRGIKRNTLQHLPPSPRVLPDVRVPVVAGGEAGRSECGLGAGKDRGGIEGPTPNRRGSEGGGGEDGQGDVPLMKPGTVTAQSGTAATSLITPARPSLAAAVVIVHPSRWPWRCRPAFFWRSPGTCRA